MVNLRFGLFNLGGGHGQPKGGLLGGGANSNSGSGMEGGNDRAMNRKVLRKSFGNEIQTATYTYNGDLLHFTMNMNMNNDSETNNMLLTMYGNATKNLSVSVWETSNNSITANTLRTAIINDLSNLSVNSNNTIVSPLSKNTILYSIASPCNNCNVFQVEITIDNDISLNNLNNYLDNSNSVLPSYISNIIVIEPSMFTQMDGPVSAYSGLTPFRRVMNAGDINMTNNKATSNLLKKPPNQVTVNKSSLAGWKSHAGMVSRVQDDTINTINNGPIGSYYTGNPKYVYDGSDYTRFKKLQAVNRNYDDKSFGGDRSHTAKVSLSRVRH